METSDAPPFERITLREDPRIRAVAHLFPPDVCTQLIELGRNGGRAEVFDADGYQTIQSVRTNTSATLDVRHPVVRFAQRRISEATGLPIGAMEDPQVLRYEVGQSFAPHYDFFDAAAPGHAERLKRGQRLVTCIVYLNEDFEAGETDFPHLGFKIKGRTGDGLYWSNLNRDNQPDRRMLHAGLPPTEGVKWLLSQWIRNKHWVRKS
jgi:hypothetical protein